jgi:hypothetical protein
LYQIEGKLRDWKMGVVRPYICSNSMSSSSLVNICVTLDFLPPFCLSLRQCCSFLTFSYACIHTLAPSVLKCDVIFSFLKKIWYAFARRDINRTVWSKEGRHFYAYGLLVWLHSLARMLYSISIGFFWFLTIGSHAEIV